MQKAATIFLEAVTLNSWKEMAALKLIICSKLDDAMPYVPGSTKLGSKFW